MAVSVDSHIQSELRRLADFVINDCGFPRRIFAKQNPQVLKCSVDFCVTNEENLKFENFYGDLHILSQIPNLKFFAVNSSSGRETTVNLRCIEDRVTKCIDSVQDERDIATLTLNLNKVYFGVHKNYNLSDRSLILRKIKAMDTTLQMYNTTLHTSRSSCEWQSPFRALQFIEEQGFERISREKMDPELLFFLRGRDLNRKTSTGSEYFINKCLLLDSSTLRVKRWRIQNHYPSTSYLLHGFTSANDIVIKTNVSRYVSVEDLQRSGLRLSPMWTESGLNHILERTDVGFRLNSSDSSVKSITEIGRGERVRFKYKSVNLSVILHRVKYYFYSASTNEFHLTDDVSCQASVEFSLNADRRDLIEAVSHLTKACFLAENVELPITTSPQFVMEDNGRRIPVVDIQAILRLRDQQGSLATLLGLSEGPTKQQLESKSRHVKAIMERGVGRNWVRKMKIDLDHLMTKLSNACDEIGVHL